MTLSGGPLASYDVTHLGHVFFQDPTTGTVTCRACPLTFSALEVLEAGIPDSAGEPCPGTEEGRRLLAQAEREARPVITEPCVAVPEGWEGTEAEAIGLAVAGAVADLQRQRDESAAALERALDLISTLVAAMPETSWAGSNVATERAQDFLREHRPTPSSDQ